MKKAGCFHTAGSAHLISGTTAFPGVESCQKSCIRIWSSFHTASLCHPHSSTKTHSWLNSCCSPSWRDHRAHCTARSPQHVHVTPQVKILNQPTFHKCTIHARHWCQTGQTAGMGTRAPLRACAVPDIPPASWGWAGIPDVHVQTHKCPFLAYLPCKLCHFPRSSQPVNMPF